MLSKPTHSPKSKLYANNLPRLRPKKEKENFLSHAPLIPFRSKWVGICFFWLVICFPLTIALVASTFYQILILIDLEADYVNPHEASSRINCLFAPEFIGQATLCALFLLTGHWFMILLTIPVTAYHLILYAKQQHLLDVTEMFRTVKAEKKYRIIKFASYLLTLAVVVFRVIAAGTIMFHNLKFEDVRSTLFEF